MFPFRQESKTTPREITNMEIKEVVEAWQKGELTGEAAMCVIHNILYPGVIDQEDIDWALSNCGGREPRPGSGFKPHEL